MKIREMITLNKYGVIPNQIVSSWGSNHNHLGMLKEFENYSVRTEMCNIFLWTGLLFTVFFVVTEDAYSIMFGVVGSTSLLAAVFLSAFTVLCPGKALWRLARDIEALRRHQFKAFGVDVRVLQVEACGRLVSRAQNVIEVERGFGSVSDEAEENRLYFRLDHTLFAKFGLVLPEWNNYFKIAKEKLKKEETKVVQKETAAT